MLLFTLTPIPLLYKWLLQKKKKKLGKDLLHRRTRNIYLSVIRELAHPKFNIEI
jgi:hypothetical protein